MLELTVSSPLDPVCAEERVTMPMFVPSARGLGTGTHRVNTVMSENNTQRLCHIESFADHRPPLRCQSFSEITAPPVDKLDL